MELYIKLYAVIAEQLGTCGMATIVESRKVLGDFETREEAENFIKNYQKENAYIDINIIPHFEKYNKVD